MLEGKDNLREHDTRISEIVCLLVSLTSIAAIIYQQEEIGPSGIVYFIPNYRSIGSVARLSTYSQFVFEVATCFCLLETAAAASCRVS